MSSTQTLARRLDRSFEDRSPEASDKADNKPLTIQALTKSINSLDDAASRKRLADLQRQAIASGGAYTKLEREMINRLVTAVKDGGNLELALAAEVIDVVGDLAKRNPKGELYENQRQIAFLLLDAIGSSKHDQKQLKPIIDEFRRLSTDEDGFTEKDAQRIRDLLRKLDMLDKAGGGDKRPGGSYRDIDDVDGSRPGKLVPGKLDLGDIKLPKDGGKGQGGAGGKDDKDDKDEGGKDTRGADDKGRDPKGKDPEGKDTKGTDGKGRGGAGGKDDKDEDGKGTDGEAKPKPGDVAVAIGVIQGLAGGADKKNDQDKGGKDDARGTDGKGRDPKGKDPEGKDTEGTDDKGTDDKGKDDARGTDDKSRDPKGKDPEGKDDKGKDDKGKGEDRRVEGPDGPPTDIKLPRNVIDGKFPEGTRVQDPEDPEDPVKSKPDDVDGGNEAKAKDPKDPATEEPQPKGPGPVDKDGNPVSLRVSASVAAVVLRTPDPPVMKKGNPEDLAKNKTIIKLADIKGVGVLYFQFRKGAIDPVLGQTYDLYQSPTAKGPWVNISQGWSANAKVQYGTTYELTAGAVGTAGVSSATKDDLLGGSGANAYMQIKWLDTIRIQEEGWSTKDRDQGKEGKRQFRVRAISQATGQLGGATRGGDPELTYNKLLETRLEYRWGTTTRVQGKDGKEDKDDKDKDGARGTDDKGRDPKGKDGAPDSFGQYEVGVGFGVGVAVNLVALGKAAEEGDTDKIKQILAESPRAAVTIQLWYTGLKKLEAWTHQAAKALTDNDKKQPGKFAKTLAAGLKAFGATFQSFVASAFVTGTVRGNDPNSPEGKGGGLTAVTVANNINAPSNPESPGGDQSSGELPTQEELMGMADSVLADVKGLFAWLEKSGLADLAKMAQPLIELASLAQGAKKLFSKKGLIDFTLDKLNPQQRDRMTDSIMARAFELAAAEMGKVPDIKSGKGLDARNSFMKLPGESAAEYGARVIALVLKQVPKAAAEILSSDIDFDNILVGPDLTGPAKAAALAAAIALLNGEDDENEDDNGGKKDKTGKDGKNEPTATGGPGGSRNAALNAVHEADEAQGDRLPVTVEAEASIYITPKLAADPVYMAAYVARLAHDQDDVAAARKYAAAMSDLGHSKDAARVLAPVLTNAEIADPAFMKTLDAALAGIKRQLSDVGGVIYETQVKAALEALRGKQPAEPSQVRGALEALRGKQPADPSAEPTGGGSRDKAPTDTDDPGNTNTEDPETEEPETELPTTARQKLAELIVQTGSKKDLWANVDEMRAGLEELGYTTGHLSDGQFNRLISAYNADGNGAMSAAQIAQALQDGALLADGATVDIDLGAAFKQPGAPLNIAQRVLRNGSDSDAWASRRELEKGFKAAGFDVKARDDEMDRVIATYGVSGTGALTAQELASAIEDGVIHLGADGSVTVNTQALRAVQGEGAANIASRVVNAAQRASDSRDGSLPGEAFLSGGFKEAGYDLSGVSGDDMEWLIDAYGDGARIAQEGLARAIAEGAVRIAADGVVTINRNPTRRADGAGIDEPVVRQPGSIGIDGQPA